MRNVTRAAERLIDELNGLKGGEYEAPCITNAKLAIADAREYINTLPDPSREMIATEGKCSAWDSSTGQTIEADSPGQLLDKLAQPN